MAMNFFLKWTQSSIKDSCELETFLSLNHYIVRVNHIITNCIVQRNSGISPNNNIAFITFWV